jgi:hypothetical protein
MYFFSHRKGHALQQNRRFSRLFVFNNSSLISPPFVHFITKKAASLLRQPLFFYGPLIIANGITEVKIRE